ncbi:modular polyketide synthase [Labilithrix luteola]|uniref:Modular polyketide synthase n=1 Tax=Labilithrix luteola TaxID=1391654 RepID=A0A0K1PNI4_9BACT|nr:type I polyketide synthase [Labilithrix luteola]AKU95088.1 modular polyketide synthase [Labilithrix luteola]
MAAPVRIAVAGMACVFPGAADVSTYWDNIVRGVDALSDAPEQRLDPLYFDPQSTDADRFYCRRGGFVDAFAAVNPLALGVLPKTMASTEPDQLLTLELGTRALADAGYDRERRPPQRTGVILGRGGHMSTGKLRLVEHVRVLPQLLTTLRDLFPGIPDDALERVRERVRDELSYFGPDVASGNVPNLVASRLANRFDLHGPAYAVDAACASSLLALEQSCMLLGQGSVDLMVAGGVHLAQEATLWATFCQLGAMSRSGAIRPFAADADGVLLGEGVGVVVLKRLDDAIAAGDRIYAVIEGVGSASDGSRSALLAPAVEGQLEALERAWSPLSLPRSSLGLLEGHGTGTKAGDAAELKTISAFFGAHDGVETKPVLGTIKSMIGHPMAAAGIAGFIKAVLAVHHGVLPPTLHCKEPHPLLSTTRFRTIGAAEPWPLEPGKRVAAVNAFGFGGINAHAIVRGYEAPSARVSAPTSKKVAPPVLLLSAETREALLARLEAGEETDAPSSDGGPYRLAIVEPNDHKRTIAKKALASGRPWRGRSDVYFSGEGLIANGGRLAFVFPGLDSTFDPKVGDVADHLGLPLPPVHERLDPGARVFDVVRGVVGVNQFMLDAVRALGIRPDAVAGHSIGEWNALEAAGVIAREHLDSRRMLGAEGVTVAPADEVFLAAACDVALVRKEMDGLGDQLTITHDNAPHQVLVSGPREAIEVLRVRLKAASVMCQSVPFGGGFHTSAFASFVERARPYFERLPMTAPSVPVWSATSAALFPDTEASRRALALSLLVQPVRFRDLIEGMYDAGHRVFVQIGAGSLPQMIDDTLRGREHLVVAAYRNDRPALTQLVGLCAALWVEGASFDNRLLERGTSSTSRTPRPASAKPSGARDQRVPLALGVPFVRMEPLDWSPDVATPVDEAGTDDVMQRIWHDTRSDIERARRDVMAVIRQTRVSPPPAAPRLDVRVARYLDLATTIPEVVDHAMHPQRERWPFVADTTPTVPMAMMVELVRQAVAEALPGMKVAELRDAQAYRWLAVATPLTVHIRLTERTDGAIEAEIEGHFKATIIVSRDYPRFEDAALAPLARANDAMLDGLSMYRMRQSFHGPAYQGLRRILRFGNEGIEGDVIVPAGRGGLLDALLQLSGYWIATQSENGVSAPVGFERLRFHGPDPAIGERLHDDVRAVLRGEGTCVSQHRLTDEAGRVRLSLDGCQQRQLGLIGIRHKIQQIDTSALSEPVARGVALFDDRYDTTAARDYLARLYLTASENAVYERIGPRDRRRWLNGRIVAKDAVRELVRRGGQASIFPKEIVLEGGVDGALTAGPNVTSIVPRGLHVAVAHRAYASAAVASERPVSIDIADDKNVMWKFSS